MTAPEATLCGSFMDYAMPARDLGFLSFVTQRSARFAWLQSYRLVIRLAGEGGHDAGIGVVINDIVDCAQTRSAGPPRARMTGEGRPHLATDVTGVAP